jgi:hypothetical protein
LSLCARCFRSKPSNLHRYTRHFAKRTQIEKSLTFCLSIRNKIFRANLAQKTNPKRTHFSTTPSHPFSRLRLENFSGAWRLALGILPSLFGLPPQPKSTPDSVCERLIRVENGLIPAFHRPKIRPENKGIKPFTNRHKPKSPAAALVDVGNLLRMLLLSKSTPRRCLRRNFTCSPAPFAAM